MSALIVKQSTNNILYFKYIFILRLLFGLYNNNVSSSKCFNFLAKLYCICFGFFNTAIYLYVFSENYKARGLLYGKAIIFLPFILNILTSLVFADKYFVKYCKAIETNDTIMGCKTTMITRNMIAVLVVTIVLRVTLIIIGQVFVSQQPISTLLTDALTTLSMDINQVQAVWILFLLQSRMSLLAGFFEKIPIPININGNRNGVTVCVKKIRKGLYNYNALLNDVQYFDKPMQFLVRCFIYVILIASLLHCVPRTTLYMHEIASTYMRHESSFLLLHRFGGVMCTVFILSLPMAMSQAIISSVDEIKTILSKKILRCSDEFVRSELEAASEYINLRAFSYSICRIISLDINLVYVLVSVCVTYAIVSLQFGIFAT